MQHIYSSNSRVQLAEMAKVSVSSNPWQPQPDLLAQEGPKGCLLGQGTSVQNTNPAVSL